MDIKALARQYGGDNGEQFYFTLEELEALSARIIKEARHEKKLGPRYVRVRSADQRAIANVYGTIEGFNADAWFDTVDREMLMLCPGDDPNR